MSLRYRKSTKIGPFRLTTSRNGLSVSAGVKGARVSLGSDGKIRRTVSIPGSGLSDTKAIGKLGHGAAESTMVTRDADNNVSLTIDATHRPSFGGLMALQNAGLSGREFKMAVALWWEHWDTTTQPSHNPLSPDSKFNRRIRARRLARLRAGQPAAD